MIKSELLAPAGDFERLKIALLYGADAVYFGGKDYGMRANALNFSLEDIKKAADFAHSLKKRVYVTVNIVFHEEDIKGLDDYLIALSEIGVDAIIISDPLVIKHMKRLNLKTPLFLSTQVSCLNHETAKFWMEQGIKRIVLAREATREDIIKIKETGAEVEMFIHGAMCVSFSGRCVLSNYATNRDSNRGGCAQICRWSFISEDLKNDFTMTPKDLQMLPFIKELMEIGVDSFKVEGRMRSIYYIATVIDAYRKIIDKIGNNSLTDAYTNYYLNILNRCANRESAPQFYHKFPGAEEQYFLDRDEVSNQDFLGIIKSYDAKTKIATIEQRNFFATGDTIEIFGPNTNPFALKVEEIYDENMNIIDVARHPQMQIKIRIDGSVNEYDMLRKKGFDNYGFM